MKDAYRSAPDGSSMDEKLYRCHLLLDRCVELDKRKDDAERSERDAMEMVLRLFAELRTSKAFLTFSATFFLLALMFQAHWIFVACSMTALLTAWTKTMQLYEAKESALSLHRRAESNASCAALEALEAWRMLMPLAAPLLLRPTPAGERIDESASSSLEGS